MISTVVIAEVWTKQLFHGSKKNISDIEPLTENPVFGSIIQTFLLIWIMFIRHVAFACTIFFGEC